MDMHTILLFALASLTLNLIPGPDVIYIVSNTMKGKASAGTQAALGLGVGYMFHTFAAVFGLSALILSSAYAFMLVKYLGAAYLLYLGISSLRNFMKGESKLTLPDQKPETTNVFRQGVIVSVLNPKVAMFFLSFLPQFIDTSLSSSATQQLLVLGLLFCGLATLCNSAYAMLGSWIVNSAKASRFSRIIEGVSGLLLIGLAAKIAFSNNRG
ncbi:lysine transporter LysE [Photobacterium proteolyticum]|uniref:Lysine transporter LysE n=1 Tax=Photobacterium proteolyticum TaxID=1903952 RepID=A0A1Q9G9Z0_9GAMM|nr:LysE family translocator [Photobacterium proteolyticum]OLQ71178.1 lysine transporter LysE [Photobacterium proteolyticum]